MDVLDVKVASSSGGKVSFEGVVAICSIVIAVVAVGFAAQQTRAATKQVRIGNAIAGASTTDSVFVNLHNALRIIIDHPELYPYFYESKPVPQSGETRVRVLVTAEMLCDVLSIGLRAAEQIPSTGHGLNLWRDYSLQMFKSCPAIGEVVDRDPDLWHYLAPLRTAPAT
ncbi:hypothetical protein [Streptosporangium sp. NPDC002607]